MAILGVITVHTSQWMLPSSGLLRQMAAEGARGVQLFYIASALTIFLSLRSRSTTEAAPIRNYFIRRFFRIAPLFYIGVVFWLLVDGFSPRYWAPNGIDGWTVFLTVFFLHGLDPESITSLVPGGWSIAVEVTFYVIAPLLCLYIKTLWDVVGVFVVSLLVNVFMSYVVGRFVLAGYFLPQHQYLSDNYLFLWFFAQLPVFMLGMVVYCCVNNDYFRPGSRLSGYLMLLTVVLLWAFQLKYQITGPILPLILPSHVLYGASFVLLSLALFIYPTRILVNSVMRKIGEISFSLYIFHFMVIRVFEEVRLRDVLSLQGNVGFGLAWLLVLATSCMVSLVTYRYVERPGIGVGRMLIDYLERKSVLERGG